MSLAVGTKGVDSASPLNSAAVKAAGLAFQVRYSSGAATAANHPSHAGSSFKLLRAGEFAAILAAGLDFIANDEWSTDRMYGGAAAAEQDAPAVLAYWRAQGLAKGATIMLNHDTGLDMSRMAAIDQYFDRYNKILGGEYLADGFYGPLAGARQLAQSGRIKHFWIPEGASFFGPNVALTNPPPPARTAWNLWQPTPSQVNYSIQWLLAQIGADAAHLDSIVWQDLNHLFGGAADENIVLKGNRFGSHRDALAKPAAPVATSKPASIGSVTYTGIPMGKALISPNGRYVAVFQSDGNFVKYDWSSGHGVALWSSGTANKGAVRLVVQSDGNVVIYNNKGVALWNTKTFAHAVNAASASQLQQQSDGPLCVYRRTGGAALWHV